MGPFPANRPRGPNPTCCDQANLYAYVGNDPINNTDPTGLMGEVLQEEEKPKPQEEEIIEEIVVTARPEGTGPSGSDFWPRMRYRDVGLIIGGVVGGIIGGGAGGAAGLSCGPALLACSPVAAIVAGAKGAAVGAGVGLLIGTFIENTISIINMMSASGDGGNKQFNGRPGSNGRQNRQVSDAARAERLNDRQREKLGDTVERLSRKEGENLSYHDIREIARDIKSGNY
jgi:hypothetical protein